MRPRLPNRKVGDADGRTIPWNSRVSGPCVYPRTLMFVTYDRDNPSGPPSTHCDTSQRLSRMLKTDADGDAGVPYTTAWTRTAVSPLDSLNFNSTRLFAEPAKTPTDGTLASTSSDQANSSPKAQVGRPRRRSSACTFKAHFDSASCEASMSPSSRRGSPESRQTSSLPVDTSAD